MTIAPRLLSFDVFRTLLDIEENKDSPAAFALLARFLAYHGIVIEGELLHQRMTTLTTRQIALSSSPTPDVDVLKILESALDGDIDSDFLGEAALVLRAATTALSSVPGAHTAVTRLAAAWPLAVCSNTQRAYTIAELRAFNFLPYFGTIVFSSDIGACKPDPRIFHRLFAEAGVSSADVIHIGDDYRNDIVTAKNLGCKTIWVDRYNQSTQSGFDQSAADAVVGPDLTDLPRIIAECWT